LRVRELAGVVLAAGDPRRRDGLVFAVGRDKQPRGDVEGRADPVSRISAATPMRTSVASTFR